MISSNSHLKYAKALYRVAEKNSAAEVVLKDLEALSRLFKHKGFADLIKKINAGNNANLPKILTGIFGDKVNMYTLNLLLLLAKNRKLTLAPYIVEAYRQLYHETKKIKDLRILTARKLDHEEEKNITKSLEAKIGSKVSVRYEENPDLIGGMQIFEQGYLTDYSVRNYLEMMRKSLLA